MNEKEVIEKICDRLVTVLYNELDYYMFEELGYTETDDKYVEDADKLVTKIINMIFIAFPIAAALIISVTILLDTVVELFNNK